MKADRLLSELLLLQAHGRMTAREISRRLEVSVRTVHRDMDALGAAGVPVYALRGTQGGWMLDEEWRTQVPGLDEAELTALLMAQPRAVGDDRIAAAAERALAKLTAAMPAALRERAGSIRQRLYVDTTGWTGAVEDLSALPVVQEAVWGDRRLAVRYTGTEGAGVERVVDPLGLVAKSGTWYLFARTQRGFRTFRVSRISEARVLDEPCERPADFDLASEWTASTGRYRDRWPPYEATLLADEGVAGVLSRWIQVSSIAEEGGRSRVRVTFESEEHACFVVLGLGPKVEVLEPEALRDRVAASVAAMAGRLSRAAGLR